MKKALIVLTVFIFDRLTKIYLINLQSNGTDIDFYIFSFLNFYLVWNTGIGFGLDITRNKRFLSRSNHTNWGN